MPRQDIPLTEITRSGTAPATEVTPVAADDLKFTNDGKVFILVRNSGAGSNTATFVTPGSVDDQAVADRDVAVPASASRYAGPFPTAQYNQGDGTVYVDVANTELRFSAYHLA